MNVVIHETDAERMAGKKSENIRVIFRCGVE